MVDKGVILFYIDSMQKGGANRVMANVTDYFAEHGYRVILVNDILPVDGIPEYTVNPKVKRMFLSDSATKQEKSNFKRILRLRKIITNEKARSVVSFMGPPNFRMLLASLGLPCRKIVSVRNDPYKEYGRQRIKKWIAGQLFKTANGCIFQTKEAAFYFPKSVQNKSTVIFNPVNEEFYQEEQSPNPHNIITVGRLNVQKNHKLLIEAFSLIEAFVPEDKLIIYGEGELRNELELFIIQKGLEGRVELPGNMPDIPSKLKQAKCFVLSSDCEGMPNALMEAMAVGIPVISTDCPCGGPKTLIENDNQGLLVTCGDARMLAEKLKHVLSSPQIQREMSHAAKSRAEVFRADRIYTLWEQYVCR